MYLLLFALVPSLAFIIMVWRMDKVEKEPFGLLLKLFLLGMLSCLPAILLESAGEAFFLQFFDESSLLYIIIDNFITVALVEEACKLFFLYRGSWKNRNFNYSFDGIVYAVCVGIGFAFFEDIFYIMDGDITTAILRAVLSIPGHGVYAILMGHYYSRARIMQSIGRKSTRRSNMWKALLVPSFFHGLYDFCLSTESLLLVAGIVIFEIVLYVQAYKTMRMRSKSDTPMP